MKYIIYLSSASIYFYPEKLPDMLVSFRKNNEANHITGMMLFGDGSFLQVLEGEDPDIDALLKKIKKDKRHHSLVQLDSKQIKERIFPGWSMGFKIASADMLKTLKGFADTADPDTFPAEPQGMHPAVAILKNFAANTRM